MPCDPTDRLTTHRRVDTADLDRVLFIAPYIVIGEDNQPRHIAHSADDASRLLATDPLARSIVGTLRSPAVGVDVDPGDTAGEPETGVALADDLVQWADRLGLPWLRRASGRDGHFHVIVDLPEALTTEFNELVSASAARHEVSATVRRTLRLTAARHRLGLPCPLLDGTLDARVSAQPTKPHKRRPRQLSAGRTSSVLGRSRSEGEYGNALALARAGVTPDEAWAGASSSGSKAREIGRRAWRRWFWAPATTVVAAELRLPEKEAWKRFASASPVQAAYLGRTRWRATRWVPALAEARRDRPRRRRLRSSSTYQPTLSSSPDRASRVAATGAALRAAAERARPVRGIRMRSLVAALDALAEAIVYADGAISTRCWAERARLDPKTVRHARDAAVKLGLIRRIHRYRGGSADSDHWALTERLESLTCLSTSAKSPTTYTPVYGEADAVALRARHAADRAAWRRFLSKRGQAATTATVIRGRGLGSEEDAGERHAGARQRHVRSRSQHCRQPHARPLPLVPSGQSPWPGWKSALACAPRGTHRPPRRGRSSSGKPEEGRPPP